MADNRGFIKLYRCCRNNSLWLEKPFSRWQAFEYLLLAAAYEPTDALIKNKVVHLERSQLIRAVRTLAADWGWSTKKVINFLTLLENTKMATSKGTPQGTLITIEKYNFYQGEGQAEGVAQETRWKRNGNKKGDVEEIKESKEVKEVKNNIYAELPPALVLALKDFEEMRKKKRNPMTDRARELLLKKLTALTGGDVEECVALLEESTEKGWASVYPKKPEKGDDRSFIGILSDYEDE